MTALWKEIDLNCDLGEGIAEDAKIIPLVSSCSLACGGHAGTPEILRELLSMAQHYNTRAGAHPSYPDKRHFGRRSMAMAPADFRASIREQLDTFRSASEATGVPMSHIKAHGALYNDSSWDIPLGLEYLEALAPYRDSCRLFLPCGSPLISEARNEGYQVLEEGFADRAYLKSGRLVSRAVEGAVLQDPEGVWKQVLGMLRENRVPALEGGFWKLHPDTLCLHGDTPNALEILTYLRRKMPENHIRLSK